VDRGRREVEQERLGHRPAGRGRRAVAAAAVRRGVLLDDVDRALAEELDRVLA
jgi:hypothetical protein